MMNKRTFIKTTLTTATGLIAGNALISCKNVTEKNIQQKDKKAANAAKIPDNWVWLRPRLGLSDKEWIDIFTKIKTSGIEAVLVQIYSSHKALFNWPGQPVKEQLLERIVPLANQVGLQIHAWMWSMPCNDPQIIKNHPDWYAVNRAGEGTYNKPAYVGYYKFLCSRKTGVQQYVKSRVEALAKIEGLDGIHLDYIRLPDVILAEGLQPKYKIVQDKEYPKYDYCYCKDCRAQYKAISGQDPLEIDNPAADKDWYQFRYDGVVNLVNQHLVPTAKKYNKMITAAVFPNWESVRQQWHRFDLDAFLPMLYHQFYNQDIHWIKEEVAKGLDRLNHSKPVISGLFVPHLSAAELPKAIALSKEGGAKGVCFFGYGNLKDQHWEAVAKALKG